jgi:hypothetical protein
MAIVSVEEAEIGTVAELTSITGSTDGMTTAGEVATAAGAAAAAMPPGIVTAGPTLPVSPEA